MSIVIVTSGWVVFVDFSPSLIFLSLQPMLQEYEDYAPKIDEVNDLGNAYEAMINPNERPMSPIRRLGRKNLFFCVLLCLNLGHL